MNTITRHEKHTSKAVQERSIPLVRNVQSSGRPEAAELAESAGLGGIVLQRHNVAASGIAIDLAY